MPVDALVDPKNVNVKDFEIPIPQDLPFNPERDITQEDKSRIRDLLVRDSEKASMLPSTVLALKTVLATEDIPPEALDAYWTELCGRHPTLTPDSRQRPYFIGNLAVEQLGLPDRVNALNHNDISGILYQIVSGFSGEERKVRDYGDLRNLLALRVFHTEQSDFRDLPRQAIDEERDEIDKELREDLRKIENMDVKNKPGYFIDCIDKFAFIKLLAPDVIESLNLDTFWRKAKQLVQVERSKLRMFASIVPLLYILYSEKAEITEDGLKLTMPATPPSVQASPPIPEEREF